MNNNNSSHKYDLSIGNVEEWRKRERIANDASRPGYWTPQRSKAIFFMRNRGQKKTRRDFDLFAVLSVWGERAFMMLVCAAGVGVVYIFASVIFALLSGRIEAVIESIRAAH